MVYGLYFGSVQFNLGFYVGLKAFTAAVLGGIGNTIGAAVGGFIIAFIKVTAAQLGYNRWSEVAVFTVLILVLVFRPSGLFGQPSGRAGMTAKAAAAPRSDWRAPIRKFRDEHHSLTIILIWLVIAVTLPLIVQIPPLSTFQTANRAGSTDSPYPASTSCSPSG